MMALGREEDDGLEDEAEEEDKSDESSSSGRVNLLVRLLKGLLMVCWGGDSRVLPSKDKLSASDSLLVSPRTAAKGKIGPDGFSSVKVVAGVAVLDGM